MSLSPINLITDRMPECMKKMFGLTPARQLTPIEQLKAEDRTIKTAVIVSLTMMSYIGVLALHSFVCSHGFSQTGGILLLGVGFYGLIGLATALISHRKREKIKKENNIIEETPEMHYKWSDFKWELDEYGKKIDSLIGRVEKVDSSDLAKINKGEKKN